ncbi:putative metalloprotease CJM1_0395 family protein [Pseudoalteromonas fenneropenaei]|uniref:Metalloprotease CJM1_0395 family protein n=1 Tax=Pseudoalteromonas fenneropenaei TaxID=1737459 RepID=A0ABV7CQF9_9GAMM
MNIVTPQPAINLNIGNVHTETARRDNQLREVIPQPSSATPSFTDNRAFQDSDKAKGQPQDEKGLYDKKVQLEDKHAISGREAKHQEGEGEAEGDENRHQQRQAEADLKQLEQLKDRDREVRLHEQAHARVGGSHAGSPSYEFQRGSDGNNYAVGGEVMIDVSEVPGDPQATIEKMQTVRSAALAPAEPSGADRAIAADATQKIAQAQADLAKQALNADDEESSNDGIGTYQRRRLSGEEEGKEAKLESAADIFLAGDDEQEFAVVARRQALEVSRDPEVNARASRIADFYQHVYEPKSVSGFSRVI